MKHRLRKGLTLGIICLLMLVTVPIFNGKTNDNLKEDDLKSEYGNFRFGFVCGQFHSILEENNSLVITVEVTLSGNCFRFLVPFRHGRLYFERIRIKHFIGIKTSKLIVGLCRIYMPKAEILMHVSSHNDSENQVFWQIDEINGDSIWWRNLDIDLFDESGESYLIAYGPVEGDEYLRVGEKIHVHCKEGDGYYYTRFTERVSGDVLFESGLVKY